MLFHKSKGLHFDANPYYAGCYYREVNMAFNRVFNVTIFALKIVLNDQIEGYQKTHSVHFLQ